MLEELFKNSAAYLKNIFKDRDSHFRDEFAFLNAKEMEVLKASPDLQNICRAVIDQAQKEQQSADADQVADPDFRICSFEQLRSADPLAETLSEVESGSTAPARRRVSPVSLHKLKTIAKIMKRADESAITYPRFKFIERDHAPSIIFIPSNIMVLKLMLIAVVKERASQLGKEGGK